MLSPLPRWATPDAVERLLLRRASAFPGCRAGRRPRLHFRGLLRVHSRYGLWGCRPPKAASCPRASTPAVADRSRLVASGVNRQLPAQDFHLLVTCTSWKGTAPLHTWRTGNGRADRVVQAGARNELEDLRDDVLDELGRLGRAGRAARSSDQSSDAIPASSPRSAPRSSRRAQAVARNRSPPGRARTPGEAPARRRQGLQADARCLSDQSWRYRPRTHRPRGAAGRGSTGPRIRALGQAFGE